VALPPRHRRQLDFFFLYALTDGELLWQSETMATADGLGWVDQDSFAAYSYPDMNSDVVDHLFIDTTNETIAHLPATPGWQMLRVGEYVAGVMGAHLQVMPIDGGPVGELRLLPSEMHHLAAVLDPGAEITGTTAVAEAAPPAHPEVSTAMGGSHVTEASVPWPVISAAAVLILAALVGMILWRRSSAS
jgi:hypothetical protein